MCVWYLEPSCDPMPRRLPRQVSESVQSPRAVCLGPESLSCLHGLFVWDLRVSPAALPGMLTVVICRRGVSSPSFSSSVSHSLILNIFPCDVILISICLSCLGALDGALLLSPEVFNHHLKYFFTASQPFIV